MADPLMNPLFSHLWYAIRNFEAPSEEQLSAMAGEPLQILDDSDNEWWYCLNLRSQMTGYIPAIFIESTQLRLARVNALRNKTVSMATPEDMEAMPPILRDAGQVSFNNVVTYSDGTETEGLLDQEQAFTSTVTAAVAAVGLDSSSPLAGETAGVSAAGDASSPLSPMSSPVVVTGSGAGAVRSGKSASTAGVPTSPMVATAGGGASGGKRHSISNLIKGISSKSAGGEPSPTGLGPAGSTSSSSRRGHSSSSIRPVSAPSSPELASAGQQQPLDGEFLLRIQSRIADLDLAYKVVRASHSTTTESVLRQAVEKFMPGAGEEDVYTIMNEYNLCLSVGESETILSSKSGFPVQELVKLSPEAQKNAKFLLRKADKSNLSSIRVFKDDISFKLITYNTASDTMRDLLVAALGRFGITDSPDLYSIALNAPSKGVLLPDSSRVSDFDTELDNLVAAAGGQNLSAPSTPTVAERPASIYGGSAAGASGAGLGSSHTPSSSMTALNTVTGPAGGANPLHLSAMSGSLLASSRAPRLFLVRREATEPDPLANLIQIRVYSHGFDMDVAYRSVFASRDESTKGLIKKALRRYNSSARPSDFRLEIVIQSANAPHASRFISNEELPLDVIIAVEHAYPGVPTKLYLRMKDTSMAANPTNPLSGYPIFNPRSRLMSQSIAGSMPISMDGVTGGEGPTGGVPSGRGTGSATGASTSGGSLESFVVTKVPIRLYCDGLWQNGQAEYKTMMMTDLTTAAEVCDWAVEKFAFDARVAADLRLAVLADPVGSRALEPTDFPVLIRNELMESGYSGMRWLLVRELGPALHNRVTVTIDASDIWPDSAPVDLKLHRMSTLREALRKGLRHFRPADSPRSINSQQVADLFYLSLLPESPAAGAAGSVDTPAAGGPEQPQPQPQQSQPAPTTGGSSATHQSLPPLVQEQLLSLASSSSASSRTSSLTDLPGSLTMDQIRQSPRLNLSLMLSDCDLDAGDHEDDDESVTFYLRRVDGLSGADFSGVSSLLLPLDGVSVAGTEAGHGGGVAGVADDAPPAPGGGALCNVLTEFVAPVDLPVVMPVAEAVVVAAAATAASVAPEADLSTGATEPEAASSSATTPMGALPAIDAEGLPGDKAADTGSPPAMVEMSSAAAASSPSPPSPSSSSCSSSCSSSSSVTAAASVGDGLPHPEAEGGAASVDSESSPPAVVDGGTDTGDAGGFLAPGKPATAEAGTAVPLSGPSLGLESGEEASMEEVLSS